MTPAIHVTNRLVKNEDLNHHRTLYAGRSAEWFVEAGFIAAASLARPESIVCVKIHGMTFMRPVKGGEIVTFESRIVLAGRTALHAHIRMCSQGELMMEGFITFVHVNQSGSAQPHGIKITPVFEEDLALQKRVMELLKTSLI